MNSLAAPNRHLWRWWRVVYTFFFLESATLAQTAVTNVLYETGFEFEEGFAPSKPLDELNDWSAFGSGSCGLLTNFFPGRGQQAYLGKFQTNFDNKFLYVWHDINFKPKTNEAAIARFFTSMQIVASTNPHKDEFQWAVYNTELRRLFSINFNNETQLISYSLENEVAPHDTGLSFSNNLTYKFEILMNFPRNTWSAILGAKEIISNQPMTTKDSALTLGDVDAVWIIHRTGFPGNNYMVFDDYRIIIEVSERPPSPALKLLIEKDAITRSVLVRIQGPPRFKYALDASTNLTRWTALVTNTMDDRGSNAYEEIRPVSSNKRYYRARQSP